MALTEDDGGYISLTKAREMVSDYKDDPNPNQEEIINSHYFGKNKILEVLNQKDTIGIRIYHAKGPKVDGTIVQQIILVGVDREENEIHDKLLDISTLCPPHCPPPEKRQL